MTGKTAIVTGASSGIGEATAARLADAGYKVYGTSRRAAQAGKRSFEMLTLDVTSDESVAVAVGQVIAAEGQIDLLVNNAGFGVVSGVGAPSYLARQDRLERPDDLLRHECMTFRMSTGALYAWELERGRRNWRVPVRGGVVTNDGRLRVSLAEQGLGLTYVFEPMVTEQLQTGRLQVVLESYAATVPGFFLYFPSRAQRSEPLHLFIEAAKELRVRGAK